MTSSTPEIDVAKLFYDGIWGSEHQKKLSNIGNELDKVRRYANEMVVDDLFSQTVVYLTGSAYFAGLVPIVQIESALFVEKEFRNEYAYALSVRAYIEVAGRLHKGMRLWRQYKSKSTTLDELRAGVQRLMAKYRPTKKSPDGLFKGNGFNVMTLVESLEDKIPEIVNIYGNLSSYVHGGFEEQMLTRKISWISDLKREINPIVESYEKYLSSFEMSRLTTLPN
ncbi:hypothetical protein [Ralstonia syzygii]|uniref:Uncharacterized protein n=1 Tax=Ralstonia syzygii R24 TaxID=907261 RepID=G3A0E4_9RALS|nr:hypothetical protein [Ralstonia syzygii]CCA84639.1 hypothetical protein RALSY_10615 [Ralstonia syzygii R24]